MDQVQHDRQAASQTTARKIPLDVKSAPQVKAGRKGKETAKIATQNGPGMRPKGKVCAGALPGRAKEENAPGARVPRFCREEGVKNCEG